MGHKKIPLFQSEAEEMASDIYSASRDVEVFLRLWFGDRCESFDGDCVVCKKWKAFDFLFENPFVE